MRPRKVEDIAAALQLAIRAGEYASGTRLPSERQLADQMRVARSTLRAALGELEKDGYLNRSIGCKGGWFVTDLSRPAGEWWRAMSRNRKELRDILDHRIAVECRAAELAAERRDVRTLEAMRATVERMREMLVPISAGRVDEETAAGLHALDSEFHTLLGRASGSRRIREAVQRSRAELFAAEVTLTYMELPASLPADHAAIVEAITRKDATAAGLAMRRHIEHGAEIWLRPAAIPEAC